ncbi:MAG: AAA domain-containing protein [Rhodobacterales bacterium]|nr:AAA domain-containing protein [Rhodobacterales bacterium]
MTNTGRQPGSAETEPAREFGAILDLVPPFRFLSRDDYSLFRSLARKHGAVPLSADQLSKDGVDLFQQVNAQKNPVWIATRKALLSAKGALDPYMIGGFIEDVVSEHLSSDTFNKNLAECCEAHGTSFAVTGKKVLHWAFSCSEAVHMQVEGLLSNDAGRFLSTDSQIQSILRGLSTAVRIRIPTGQDCSTEEVNVSMPRGLHERTSRLDQEDLKHIKPKISGVQATLVIGLDRRGAREPVAFAPVEIIIPAQGVPFLQFPARPMAFMLRCRSLEDVASDGFLRTTSLGLHIPPITPWRTALAHVYDKLSEAIAILMDTPKLPIEDWAFRDDRSLKALTCWIEMPCKSEIPSTSLNQLDKLAPRLDPVKSSPGLTPLAADVEPISDRISSARRLTHADPVFPLDPYQSRAAAGIASLDDLWAQAVTGPPGTGKTSMMKAVISDRVVRDLIAGRPPSMLLAGPTTQAYKNLLDAMTFDWSGAPPRGQRVFGDFPFVGAVIPTSTELSERKDVPEAERPPVSGPHLRFMRAGSVPQNLRPCFDHLELPCGSGVVIGDRQTLRFIESLLPSSAQPLKLTGSEVGTEIASAISILSAVDEAVSSILERAAEDGRSGAPNITWPTGLEEYEGVFLDRYQRLRAQKTTEPRGVIVDEALDLSIRNLAFHVGWRLGQLRFLQAAHKCRAEIPSIEADWRKAPDIQRFRIGRNALFEVKRAISFLLPVRTGTVTSAGGKSEEQFGAPAQMVVVDEAGMMGPEFVPPIMAEGRRTLAVGDPYQIAPVGMDALPVFAAVLADAGMDALKMAPWTQPDRPDPEGGPDLKGGNGMSVVETMSPYRGRHALVLQRHYRCPASIIEISNDLIYRPRGIALEAMQPDPVVSEDELPVIGAVLHNFDPPKGQTFNVAEAEGIVAAFLANYPQILAKAKGAPPAHEITLETHLDLMPEAVAFISPYRDQARHDRIPDRGQATVASKFSEADLGQEDAVYLGIIPNLMRRALMRRMPGNDKRIEDIIDRTVFGTIHALQGAEKPVVFLSCVAGTHTGFFNREAALVNVGVTRAKSNLIIARGLAFGAADPKGSAARHIAETTADARVLMPDTVVLVESRDKGAPIARGSRRFQVIATRGSIGRVTSLDQKGNPIVEHAPSADYVAGDLALAQRWLRPRQEGGFGLKRLLLATDADDEGSVIAHDLMAYLGLDQERVAALGITVRRWRLEDATSLGSGLVETLDFAPIFSADITERWAARRQRARTELRSAVSRAMMAQVRNRVEGRPPTPSALRAMMWLHTAEEKEGLRLRINLRDEAGSEFSVLASEAPGVPTRFQTREEAERVLEGVLGASDLETRETVALSPIPTKRSLFDVLGVLSWAGISPSVGLEVLQRFFEKAAGRK